MREYYNHVRQQNGYGHKIEFTHYMVEYIHVVCFVFHKLYAIRYDDLCISISSPSFVFFFFVKFHLCDIFSTIYDDF